MQSIWKIDKCVPTEFAATHLMGRGRVERFERPTKALTLFCRAVVASASRVTKLGCHTKIGVDRKFDS